MLNTAQYHKLNDHIFNIFKSTTALILNINENINKFLDMVVSRLLNVQQKIAEEGVGCLCQSQNLIRKPGASATEFSARNTRKITSAAENVSCDVFNNYTILALTLSDPHDDV